jgi:uncharacterized protein YtpQ (UPF0354 family)
MINRGSLLLRRSQCMQSLAIWLLIALAAAVLCGFGVLRLRARKPLPPAGFTKEFAKGLRSTLPSLTVDIKAERELRVTNAKGEKSTMFLDNAYAEYLRDPKALSDVIQKYGAGLAEFPGDEASIDRSRIIPIVKDRKWLAEIRGSLQARSAGPAPENVFDDLNEELVVVYAVDSPKSICYLTPKNLQDTGVARGDLRGLAVENLKRLLPKIAVHPGPLVSTVKADGNYEASLLLFDELWRSIQIKVDGDFVVAIPARDVLLVAGSQNPAGIAKLRELAAHVARESPYHLTNELFVYRDGSFKKLPQQ